MAVWRLQTNTDGGHIGQYCLDHRVAAMGWSLITCPQHIRKSIGDDFEKYLDEARSYGYKNPNVPVVKRMYYSLSAGDLIWMRHNGQYFMGRVSEDSKWQFNPTEEARQSDVANQYTNIEWKRYFEGDECSVPGAICTSFIMGSTLQRINKPYILEYSQMLYDLHAPTNSMERWFLVIRRVFIPCFRRMTAKICYVYGCITQEAIFAFLPQVRLAQNYMSAFYVILILESTYTFR